MTVTAELKEIKEMLRKIIRDMSKIRETQRQMKEEMYEVKDDLKRFREFWKKEKVDIQNRILRLEEDEIKRELMNRLLQFEKMQEAIDLKDNNNGNSVKVMWDLPVKTGGSALEDYEVEKKIEYVQGSTDKNHKSTVNIEYKKLSINEKNVILKDGRRLIKQFFGGGRTDL